MTKLRQVAYGLMTVGAILVVVGVIGLIGNIPPAAAISVVVGGALGFTGYKINTKI